jgi:predicted glycoside hydrolase/deacetylase ChbG (UPF0249 family)
MRRTDESVAVEMSPFAPRKNTAFAERKATLVSSQTSVRLVLHADDLGFNSAVTDGILLGFRRGLLTSTSILSNAPDAHRALSQWKSLLADFAADAIPSGEIRRRLDDPTVPFDLGVHLNLTQGRPLSGEEYPRELLDREGRFPGVFALFSGLRRCSDATLRQVRRELSRQIEFVLDRGLQPTHLNGHQYIEMLPAVSALLPELIERYRIRAIRVAEEPFLLRTTLLSGRSPQSWAMAEIKRFFARRFHALVDRLGTGHPDRFHGTAHAGRVDLRLMQRFVTLASPFGGNHGVVEAGQSGSKLVEIGLHPGNAAADVAPGELSAGWHDPLARDRLNELNLLISFELVEILNQRHIRLGRLAMRAVA